MKIIALAMLSTLFLLYLWSKPEKVTLCQVFFIDILKIKVCLSVCQETYALELYCLICATDIVKEFAFVLHLTA